MPIEEACHDLERLARFGQLRIDMMRVPHAVE